MLKENARHSKGSWWDHHMACGPGKRMQMWNTQLGRNSVELLQAFHGVPNADSTTPWKMKMPCREHGAPVAIRAWQRGWSVDLRIGNPCMAKVPCREYDEPQTTFLKTTQGARPSK
jgi:hypothetical protein